jgi:hypothetical protein
VTSTTPDIGDLHAMLRTWARPDVAREAAVELLIADDYWLRRPDFLAACGWAVHDGPDLPDRAGVNWDDVVAWLDAGVIGASSQLRILTLAAVIAGARAREPLPELLFGLDDVNAHLLLEALAHATRLHERRPGGVLVTGDFAGVGW